MFRVPEKRPPKAVSTAFTFLIFVPLAIMLIVVSFLCLYSSFFLWIILFKFTLALVLNCFPLYLAAQISCHSMKGKAIQDFTNWGRGGGKKNIGMSF